MTHHNLHFHAHLDANRDTDAQPDGFTDADGDSNAFRNAYTHRVHNVHADGHAGMGLGFFIAKTLIERIGGQITFGNKPKGGAIVRMSLPRKNLESPANSRG